MGLFWLLLLLVIILFIIFLFVLYYRDKQHFESKGIHYLGNGVYQLITIGFKGISMAQNIRNTYDKMKSKDLKVAGANNFGKITLMISDVDLIKQVLVKDFDHFVNRPEFPLLKNDTILSKMLSTTRGEEWKALRSKMSPTFTTGKIKRMFKIFDGSAKKLVKFVGEEMSKSESGEVDLTNGYSKLTMDVIASAACGIDSKAFDQSGPSVFEEMGQKMQIKFGGTQLIKFLLMVMLPKLADLLGLSFFAKGTMEFYSGAIKSAINYRKEKGEKRDDFIQLLLEARKGLLKTEEGELDRFEKDAMIKIKDDRSEKSIMELLDDDGIVANCVLFIFAGFDTTQSLLLYAAYSLALHPEIQERLRAEIETELEQTDGEFTYDSVAEMEYLDMFLSETLRYYPPAVATDRGCTEDYKVPGTDFTLKKGEGIAIPIIGLHFDEKYFPEPEKFNPERFSKVNRANLHPYAFMPFGHGPRNCIGMRFAMMEVKLAIGHLVKNYDIQPSGKTTIPMKFQNSASLKPVGGMWLALNKRT